MQKEMILYIGNKLSKHGNTPTSVEVLGDLLNEVFPVYQVSDKRNKLLRLADMLWSIFRQRNNILYILIDTYSTSNFYYALLSAGLAKMLDIPYIPILRGGDLERRLQNNKRFADYLFCNAAVNVAPSGYLQHAFARYGYKTLFIPNTIDIKRYTFLLRKNPRPKLLYVRAFSTLYNPKMALDVLGRLAERYEDVILCMVGPDRDGTLKEVKQKAVEMGLEERVVFAGKLEKETWWELSKEYDIFINTTNFDNTPVSVMEAMALGLPVVSTNVGGIPYLVEDGKEAMLVDANNADAMAQQIAQLIEDPSKAVALAKNARKKVETFDWESSVKQMWIKLLREDGNVTV